MPKVIHCHGIREDTETARYVGRPTIFGNPFMLQNESGREAILAAYKLWFLNRIDNNPEFKSAVLLLKGYDLACWCAPRLCHGDVILEWLERHAALEEYPFHHTETALANHIAGREVWDTNGDVW